MMDGLAVDDLSIMLCPVSVRVRRFEAPTSGRGYLIGIEQS